VLGVDPSAIVALVDDLENAGLVRREPHPDDRRTRLVVTTDQGKVTLTEARSLAARVNEELLARLNGDERAVLVDLLQRIATG
jgi:DNA-binding MarR family transcriptional regulator